MNSKKKLIKNSFFSFLQIFVSGIGLLIVYAFVLKKLGQAELGVWSIITALPSTITAVGTGVSGCILKYVPEYNVGKETRKINSLFINGFVLNFIISILIVVLGILFKIEILNFLLNTPSYPPDYLFYFEISLITLILNIINSIFFSLLDGLQHTYIKNNIIILGVITFVILTIGNIQQFGLKTIFASQMLQSLLVFCLLLLFSLKNKFIEIQYFKLSLDNIKLFIKEGKKFQAISISLILFEPLTKYFLNKYFNISVVGLYDFINRIIVQLRTLIVGSMQVLIPYVTNGKFSGDLKINLFYPQIFKLASLIGAILFTLINIIVFFIVDFYKIDNGIRVVFMTLALSISYYVNILTSLSYFILWGLSKFKHIVNSHILLIFFNYIFYKIIGNNLTERWAVLPVALSLLVSSTYIQFIFNREFNELDVCFTKKDYLIFFASFIVLLLSILVMMLSFPGVFHLFILIGSSFFFIILIFTNNFLMESANSIIRKFK